MKMHISKIREHYLKYNQIIFYVLLAGVFFALLWNISLFKKQKAMQAVVDEANDIPKTIVQEEVLGKDYLFNKLQQTGLQNNEILDIVKKLDGVMYTRKLNTKDRFLISLTEDGKFNLLMVTKDLTHYYVARVGGELVGGILDKEVKIREQSAHGEVNSSLYASMQAEGMGVPLIIAFTDVFSWNVDFNSETRNGDQYALVWEEQYTADGSIVDQYILAAKYSGSASGTNYAYFYKDDFFEEDGKMKKRMFLKSPISFRNVRITSRFSNSRMHPILRIRRPHHGIDYAAPIGTPIETIADGTATFVGVKGGFGNYIEISHANNYTSCYGHLKSFNVKKGQKVRQGAVIGTVGSSGLSTGPHLDFRIREGKKYFDFLKIKNRNSTTRELSAEEKEEFKEVIKKYKPVLDSEIKENENV